MATSAAILKRWRQQADRQLHCPHPEWKLTPEGKAYTTTHDVWTCIACGKPQARLIPRAAIEAEKKEA